MIQRQEEVFPMAIPHPQLEEPERVKSEVSPEDTTSFYTPGVFDKRGPVIWVGIARSGLDQAPDGRILTAYKAAYPLLFRWTNHVALAGTK